MTWQSTFGELPGATSRDALYYAAALAYSEVPDLRNPELAIRVAQRAIDLSQHSDGECHGVLAGALELGGNRPAAIEALRMALGLLPEGDSPVRRTYRTELQKFESEHLAESKN